MAARSPLDWGIVIASGFAVVGAAIIGFVFVPALSPDTDPWWAFGGALAFMLITMAAAHGVKRRY